MLINRSIKYFDNSNYIIDLQKLRKFSIIKYRMKILFLLYFFLKVQNYFKLLQKEEQNENFT